MLERLEEWDSNLLLFLNGLGVESWDSFWTFVTRIDSWIPLFLYFSVLIFYFYGSKKGFRVFVFTVLAFLVAHFLTHFTKIGVGRIRPSNLVDIYDGLRVLHKSDSFSFFSGHASTSFAITTFLVLSLRSFHKGVYLFFIWPLVFSFSRIYVGVHYPSDILAGVIVGVLIALIFYQISKKNLKKL